MMRVRYHETVDGGQIIVEARRRAGLTQRALAARAGVSQSLLARIERGTVTPSFDRTLQFVRACGLDLDIRLVPLDEDAWTMVEEGARLSPPDRLERMLAAARLREAGRRSREETDD